MVSEGRAQVRGQAKRAVRTMLVVCAAMVGAMPCVAAQETVPAATPALPATFTHPPVFWIPDTGSGWVPVEPDGDHIVIPVMLNGQPARAMIDTGVDQLIIAKSYVDAHHLPLTPWANTTSFGGATRYDTTPSVALDIGAVRTVKPGAVTVSDLDMLKVSALKGVDVVIGLPLLGPFEWQVDHDHHRFRLMRSGAIPIAEGIPIRVGPGNSRIVTDAWINDQPVNTVMIDTGADGEVSLSTRAAREVAFTAQTDIAAIGSGSGSTVVRPMGRLTDFRIGTHGLAGPYATVGDEDWWGSKEIQALIGMGVLRAYNLTVDLTAGRMRLDPRDAPPGPLRRSLDGVQGFVVDGRWKVAHVTRNSPAMTAGLTRGVEICAIDGKPVSPQRMAGYWRLAAPGTRHILRMCDRRSRAITLRTFY